MRMHQFYGESKDEGYLESLGGYVLSNNEKMELEKIYWLVLRPLFHCLLPKALEKGENIQKTFRKVDLLSLCLDEICAHQGDVSFFVPSITFLTRHLVQGAVDYPKLLRIFHLLSHRANFDSLRQAFQQVLEEHLSIQHLTWKELGEQLSRLR